MNFKFLNTSLHAMYRFALSVEGRGGEYWGTQKMFKSKRGESLFES